MNDMIKSNGNKDTPQCVHKTASNKLDDVHTNKQDSGNTHDV